MDHRDPEGLAPDRSSDGCYKLACRRLGVIMWKNLILRKRHWFISCCECCYPTCNVLTLVALFLFVKTVFPSSPTTQPGGDQSNFFPRLSESEMVDQLKSRMLQREVAYSPNNALTADIIKSLRTQLNAPSITFRGYKTEEEMETYASRSSSNIQLAIVFGHSFRTRTMSPSGEGSKISYKLRFRSKELDSDANAGSTPNSNPGLLALQILLDKCIIANLARPKELDNYTISVQGIPKSPSRRNKEVQVTRQMNPSTGKQSLKELVLSEISGTISFGFVFLVPSVMLGVLNEKASGIKELMKMNGLPNWMHWFGWFLNFLVVNLITISLITAMLFVSVIPAKKLVVYENSNFLLYWTILLIFSIQATTWCFLISSFFQRPSIGILTGIVLWIIFVAIERILDRFKSDLSTYSRLALCFIPNIALKFVTDIFNVHEEKDQGAGWTKLFKAYDKSTITVGAGMIVMTVSSFLFFLLAIYFESIIPSKFGIPKPFYYIFLPSTWCNTKIAALSMSTEDSQDKENQPSVEPNPEDLNAVVRISHLRKVYASGKVAVDDLTVNMYQGQITALLGHNGAGKTTTMSVLSGMCKATGGTAVIDGCDVNKNMEGVRRQLGLCPQQNMVLDDLTVDQHLQLFGRLKGMSFVDVDTEMEEVLTMLDLQDKMYFSARDLSGGQKRKLQMGMALIGKPKVVMMDEPTSGLDPEARRQIWSLLLEVRKSKTIILTTHYMEEADVLADRIAIMTEGKVQCCGTPSFLKKHYGSGYTLSLTLEPKPVGKPDLVLETVSRHVNNAVFKTQISANSAEVEIALPIAAGVNTPAKFPDMFTELMASQEAMGIKTVNVSFTTLDDVFVRVDELFYANQKKESTKSGPAIEEKDVEDGSSTNELLKDRQDGLGLVLTQFWGLLVKKMLQTIRNWTFILSQLFFIAAPVFLALLIDYSLSRAGTTRRLATSRINLASYSNPITLYTSNDKGLGSDYLAVLGKGGGIDVGPDSDLTDEFLKIGRSADGGFLLNNKYIVGAELKLSSVAASKLSITAMHSTRNSLAAPLAVNLVSNTILRRHAPSSQYSIQLYYQPLPRQSAGNPNDPAKPQETSSLTFCLTIGIFLLGATFIVIPAEERACQAKQLQLMTNASPLSYWLSFFLLDFIVVILISVALTAIFLLFTFVGLSVKHNAVVALFLTLVAFGFVAIWLSYLFTLKFEASKGFTILILSYIAQGYMYGIAVALVQTFGPTFAQRLHQVGLILPGFNAYKNLQSITEISLRNAKCDQTGATTGCVASFLVWSEHTLAGIPPEIVEIPGNLQRLVFMFAEGIIFMVVLMVLEYTLLRKLFSSPVSDKMVKGTKEDQDVTNEKLRVQDLLTKGKIFEDALVAWNLRKHYKTTIAVSNVTFGVRHGECFGLLGVNGAGKTTTFRMITGDETLSSGNVFISHTRCDIAQNRNKFISSLGYCPQFDGVIEVLTGKEMLTLFARLRGIPSNQIQKHVQKWLTRTGLSASGGIRCGRYSGGMKRRLSVAMSLIGDPPVILMDEPTSGVDPVARRQFWKLISSVKDTGQAVILTTHSMEECTAVCARLTIMVKGKMKCIGGVQYLKNKFAQGYSLNIRLKVLLSEDGMQDPPEVAELIQTIGQRFAPCLITDRHQNTIQYHLQDPAMPLAYIFKTSEEMKETYAVWIMDYTVKETTLEDVFLSFANAK